MRISVLIMVMILLSSFAYAIDSTITQLNNGSTSTTFLLDNSSKVVYVDFPSIIQLNKFNLSHSFNIFGSNSTHNGTDLFFTELNMSPSLGTAITNLSEFVNGSKVITWVNAVGIFESLTYKINVSEYQPVENISIRYSIATRAHNTSILVKNQSDGVWTTLHSNWTDNSCVCLIHYVDVPTSFIEKDVIELNITASATGNPTCASDLPCDGHTNPAGGNRGRYINHTFTVSTLHPVNISIVNDTQELNTTNEVNISKFNTYQNAYCGAGCSIPINYSTQYSANVTLQSLFINYSYGVDNCTTFGNASAVFRSYKEQYPTEDLNVSAELFSEYWLNDSERYNFTAEYASTSNFSLCALGNVYTDTYITYTSPTGFTHRYYLVNRSLTNNTVYFNLYNFNDTTGISDLKITLRNAYTYDYFPNIYGWLQRYYASEGVWRTVQMDRSGDFGLLFYNIEEQDTDYRLIYYDSSNHVLRTTTSMKFVCDTTICDLTQPLFPYDPETSTITPTIGIYFDNQSRILNTSFEVLTGEEVTVRSLVKKETLTGSVTICDDTSTGAAGLIQCNVTPYTGEFYVTVYTEGVPTEASFITENTDKLFQVLNDSTEVALWTFAFMVAIVMSALFSPAALIIVTILSLIFLAFIGMAGAISVTSIAVAAVIGIIIAIKVRQ